MSFCDLCQKTTSTCSCTTLYQSPTFYTNSAVEVCSQLEFDVLNKQFNVAMHALAYDYSQSSKEDILDCLRQARLKITELQRELTVRD